MGGLDVYKRQVVAFDGDPMEDITAMTRCCFVMKGGEVYKA